MRITRLSAENFRGFEKLELDFPSRCTVLVGANGSGKTTVLDALVRSVFATQRNGHSAHPSWPWQPEWDVANDASSAFLRTTIAAAELNAGQPFAIESHILPDRGDPTRSVPITPPGDVAARVFWSPVRDARPAGAGFSVGPIRLVDAEAFRPFFLDWESFEDRQRLAGQPDFRDPTLEAVRSALHRIWQNVTISSAHKRRELEVTKQGKRFLFPQLSSGEQRVLTLVGEVARLLAQDRPEDPDAWRRPVVLLADEIEQHLHPVWQRRILPALLDAFPGLQIIATTHSPQVVSSVASESVVLLREGQALRLERGTKGHETTQILREVFGDLGRDPVVHERLHAVRKCLDRGELSKARDILGALEREGRVEPDDEEILGLRSEAFTLAGE